ncbi:MAG: GNAT family N-acetyltransferase [Hyphomicrobiales bacterium]|nr:GNAT family N-acetyltransferase [Hyphomicrobiales bacterium]
MGAPPDIVIRDCKASDLARITEIYGQSVMRETASFELEAPDLAEMTRRRSALVEKDYPYLVAEREDVVVGYAYAGPHRPRPAYRHAVENTVYVDPAAQRRGVARALMERLIEEAQARGFRQMIAVIGDSAHIASIALHETLGFTRVGNLVSVGFKHGKWLDTVFMQRALGPGDATPPDGA